MLTKLNIQSSRLNVTIQTTDHNLLRWTVMAIDVNPIFAKSLIEFSSRTPVYLTDSIYLERYNPDVSEVPLNTHIVLWDGINSYFELMNKQAALVQRPDLKFFVVGWLKGVTIADRMNIQPLYPDVLQDSAKAWGNVFSFYQSFYVPYWYRLLTTGLTFTRYFKNWVSDAQKHRELSRGGKMVFCGLVTPSEHNLNAFFIGVDLPDLQAVCTNLLILEYNSPVAVVNQTVFKVIEAIKAVASLEASEFACIYSILNLLHRVKTLSILNQLNSELFVNEVRNNRRFDPYDSFFYCNNLYLDFGSTRGPDAIYPRTIDIVMKNKQYISLRFLHAQTSIAQYINALSLDAFLVHCEKDAQAALQRHQSMFT